MQYIAMFIRRPAGVACVPFIVFALLSLLLLANPAYAAQMEMPVAPAKGSVALIPYMDWLLDSTGKLSVDEAAASGRQAEYRPLQVRALPRAQGAFWIRLAMSARPASATPVQLFLDLGNALPGTPTLYMRTQGQQEGPWVAHRPGAGGAGGAGNIFMLHVADVEPQFLYLRLEGIPSVWFAPALRTAYNAATTVDRLVYTALLAALAMVMLLCLVRGLCERGEWRLWTSAFVGAALVSAALGIPVVGSMSARQIAAMLAPGLALMLLAHVGRHLMRTRHSSRALDVQFLLLSLPGAALALLPLIPGYAWTARYLDLWPAGTVLLLPTTIAAWLSGLPGARRFLLACLLSPACMTAAWIGMGPAVPPALVGSISLWGIALGSMIIAGAGTPQEHLSAARVATVKTVASQALVEDDPNLRIVPVDTDQPADATVQDAASIHRTDAQSLALEEALRIPIDTLLRDGAELEQCALPPAARQLCHAMLATVRGMTGAVSGAMGPAHSVLRDSAFDLQDTLRQAHDAVFMGAEGKNIALSWFMPPHLPHRYVGDGAQLGDALRMLLESAVRATSRGAVQVVVRRVPESVNPGHLLFSVTDTGTGMPPEERSSLALVRAWELAGAYKGFLGLESGPHGASISFTLHLQVANDERSPHAQNDASIILVEDSSSSRQLLAFFLEGLPYRIVEARSLQEATELHEARPATLFIVDADMPLDYTKDIQQLRVSERARSLPAATLMALTSDENTAHSLREAGIAHIVGKPVTRATLREAVCTVLADSATPEKTAPPPEESIPAQEAPAQHTQVQDIQDAPSALLIAVPDALHMHPNAEGIVETGEPLFSAAHSPDEADGPDGADTHDAPLSLEPPTALDKSNALYLHSLVTDEAVAPVPPQEAQVATATEQPAPAFSPLRLDLDDDCWVGEPTPIVKDTGSPATAATAATAATPVAPLTMATVQAAPHHTPHPLLSRGREDSVEWVGEPTPIYKKPPPTEESVPVLTQEEPVSEQARHASPESSTEPAVESAQPAFVPLSLNPIQAPAFAPASGPREKRASLIPPSMQLMDFILPQQADTTPSQTSTTASTTAAESAPLTMQPAPVPPAPVAAVETRRVYANVGEPMPIVRPQTADGQMPLEALLEDFDQSALTARQAFERVDTNAVRHAARHIAFQADSFGLRALARMARCVEDAAKAGDNDALANLLPELESFVERNRIAMRSH